jgi:hypothetical protein
MSVKPVSREARALVALVALSLFLGVGASRSGVLAQGGGGAPAAGAGGPASATPENESAQLPALTAPVRIAPDYTIKVVPTDKFDARYPRVIQLQHYAPGKGQLLATWSSSPTGMEIYRSTDNGETFQLFSEVKGLRGSPALYELPVKMGEFPAGTVMAAGSVPTKEPDTRGLGVHVSKDGGKTWEYLSTHDIGGTGRYDAADRAGLSLYQRPIFEPYLYADAKGRLVVYISDEREKKNGFSQFLGHRVSEDGGRTWGDLVYDVAIPDGLTRPGMAIVARAGNGKYFMTYEMVSMPGYVTEPRSNPVHFKVSDDGVNWGDYKSVGTLIQDRWRQFPQATPYIVWSPWPAPNGTLIVSSRAVTRYELGIVGNGMFVNRNNGEGLWTLIETPIRFIPNPSGYSQTMIPLGDGREILQLCPVDGRMMYSKFKLPEKLPEYPWPFGPRKPAAR